MKMTFRWYGEGDGIPLQYIKQIPNMSGVVTGEIGVSLVFHHIPVGRRLVNV